MSQWRQEILWAHTEYAFGSNETLHELAVVPNSSIYYEVPLVTFNKETLHIHHLLQKLSLRGKKVQKQSKQKKLLKSWRFKFKQIIEEAIRVLEILQAVVEGLQFDLMSFKAIKEQHGLWSLASECMVEDKLQNFYTEMWLMDTVKWICDKVSHGFVVYDVFHLQRPPDSVFTRANGCGSKEGRFVTNK